MSDFSFDTLDGWPDIVHAGFVTLPLGPEDKLHAAVAAKNYPAAYSALRRLEKPLSGKQAGECLAIALSRTPRLFREILAHCQPGEYVQYDRLPHPEQDGLYLHIKGTILTLAAARDKPRHMELLLEKGWDVNSAAPASAQAVYDYCGDMPFLAPSDNSILCSGQTDPSDGPVSWTISHPTPLAAAMVCGSKSAVRALLRRGGVKKLEHTAVCRAAVAALHGSKEQRECLSLALGLRSGADDPDGMARELLGRHMPCVAAVADLCTPEELALCLEGANCRREELYAAADALTRRFDPDSPHSPTPDNQDTLADSDKKLFILLDRCPELERETRVRDEMLNAILSRILTKKPCKKLLERWKAACGGVRDLSGAQFNLVSRIDAENAGKILAVLGEGGSLCASTESDWFAQWKDKRFLSVCLDRVSAYRTETGGLSELAQGLLLKGDMRLLRKAAERGALQGERREEMLASLGKGKGTPALRALVLTLPGGQAGTAPAPPQPEDAELRRQWEEMTPELRLAFMQQLWEEPLSAEECGKRLRCKKLRQAIDNWFMFHSSELDGMQLNNLSAAACCGRNPELLSALLEDGGVDPKNLESWRREDSRFSDLLNGTMLCLAAAAGRTEQVRRLLELGLDPNEDDVLERSVCRDYDFFGSTQVVTPLYMALQNGHFETAELLCRHGGYAYPEP